MLPGNKKNKLPLSPSFRFATKADQGVHTFSLNCRQFLTPRLTFAS